MCIDGQIDFVLVWRPHPNNNVIEANRARKRSYFEEKLRAEGLFVEEEERHGVHFVKVKHWR